MLEQRAGFCSFFPKWSIVNSSSYVDLTIITSLQSKKSSFFCFRMVRLDGTQQALGLVMKPISLSFQIADGYWFRAKSIEKCLGSISLQSSSTSTVSTETFVIFYDEINFLQGEFPQTISTTTPGLHLRSSCTKLT